MPEKLSQGPRQGFDLSRTGVGLGRGPKAQLMTSAAWSPTWPAPGATLDLDFVNNRGWVKGLGQGGVMDGITFTRASNATYVGSDGLLKGYTNSSGLNMVAYPQNFESWGKAGATVTVDSTTAPDGTLTADTIVCTSSGSSYCYYDFTTTAIGTVLTASAYVKAGSRNYFTLNLFGHANAYFDLSSLTSSFSGTGAISAAITDAGNGWRRLQATWTWSLVTQYRLNLLQSSSLSNTSVSTGDYTYVWGAQLEVGSAATTYYPTNLNAPRFDWANTATVGTTKYLYYSDNFIAKYGTLTGATVTQNAGATPQGTSNAVLLTENTSTGLHGWSYGVNNIYNTVHTLSFFAKPNGRTKLYVSGDYADPDGRAVFDFAAGTYALTFGLSASVTPLDNGWFRASVTYKNRNYLEMYLVNSSGATSYTGDGTSGMYIWGVQVEVSSSATPYLSVESIMPMTQPLAASTSCNGLLIEEARTNRALWCRDATSGSGTNQQVYSEQFNMWTAVETSVTADALASPTATITADLCVASVNSSAHYIYSA